MGSELFHGVPVQTEGDWGQLDSRGGSGGPPPGVSLSCAIRSLRCFGWLQTPGLSPGHITNLL